MLTPEQEHARYINNLRGKSADDTLRAVGWTVTDSGCWEWNGRRTAIGGYGCVYFRRRTVLAHRLAYQAWVGIIPAGQQIRHRECDNPPCVNPAHLLPGTQVENMRDMEERGRAVRSRGCANGNSKLSEGDVVEIRKLRSDGLYFHVIADIYGVSPSLIRQIVSRQLWRHVA